MSVEAATDFVKHISSDDEFLARVVEAPDGESRVAIVQAAGYAFEQGELEEALARMAGTEDDVMEVAPHIVARYGAPSFYSEGSLDHDPFWNRA